MILSYVEWQNQRAQILGLQVYTQLHIGTERQIAVTESPPKTLPMRGDGNCLFRTMIYFLSGRHTFHKVLRAVLMTYMGENKCTIGTIASNTDYATKTNIASLRVYGTEIDLFLQASLPQRSMCSHHTAETRMAQWQCCGPHPQLSPALTQSMKAIYICSINEHFEQVVCMD